MLEEIVVSKKTSMTIGTYSPEIKFINVIITFGKIPVDTVPQELHSLQTKKGNYVNTCFDAVKKGKISFE